MRYYIYNSYYIFILLWTISIIITIILSASVFGAIIGNKKIPTFQSKKIIFMSNIWFIPLLFTIRRLKINLFNSKLSIKPQRVDGQKYLYSRKIITYLKKYSKQFNISSRSYILGSSFLILIFIIFLFIKINQQSDLGLRR